MLLFSVFLLLGMIIQEFLQVPADRSTPMNLPRISGPITIDGHVDEPAWDEIDPLPLTSYEPVAGRPPSEATEIRIAYDDNYIYASIRAFDSEPDGIRINTLYRDRLSGDDVFHILLDTYNDNESAVGFTVTPSGAKRDATISNDGEGPNALNADFSTYWDVATHVDHRGWFAEVRIPFSSIGFQDNDGRVVMGLYVQRGISRKNERVTFPQVPAHIPRAFFRPSLAQRVVFDGIYSRRPLHITPYLTGGFGQEYLMNQNQTGYFRDDSRELDAGFDIKYGISSNLTLDLTFNTDFAQVEADDQQVNLTRFDLFFPEKRQFFQERSGVFEFNTGGNGRLFHSRRIGLTETGDQVRILGGGRLTGRVGSWDVGILNMQTDEFGNNPMENYSVLRLRRGFINPYSYAGIMGTSNVNADGNYNISYGIDGSVRLRDDDYLSWAWAQSVDEETLDMSFFDVSRFRVGWERRSRQGFAWQSNISRSGTAYNPGIGFVPRLDYFRIGQSINYGWMPGQESSLHFHSLELDGAVFWSTSTGQVESAEIGPQWSATTKPGDQIQLGLIWHYEDIRAPFPLLGRTVVPTGEYRFVRWNASYQISSSRQLRTRIEADAGTFYGGWHLATALSPSWNLSRHLELEASWLYNLVDLPHEEERFAAHIGQLRIRTALNTQLSTSGFIQMNTSANIISANIRFRYNFRDGNDFWIVFNEGINTDRHRMIPTLPRTNARALLVKYTYTFHR